MSTRHKSRSQYSNHQRAEELRDQAAHTHLSAAQSRDQQDYLTGHEQSRQALEHSHETYVQAETLHSGGTHQHDVTVVEEEETATLAHTLWQARGCPEGSPNEDWFHASELLRSHLKE
jgi:hypothetical protein